MNRIARRVCPPVLLRLFTTLLAFAISSASLASDGGLGPKRLWDDRWSNDRVLSFLPEEAFASLDFSDLEAVDLAALGIADRDLGFTRQGIALYRDAMRKREGACGRRTKHPSPSSPGSDLAGYLREKKLAFIGEVVKLGNGWSVNLGPSTLVYIEIQEILIDREGHYQAGDVVTYQKTDGSVTFPGIGRICTEYVGPPETTPEAIGMKLLVVGIPKDKAAPGHINRLNVVELVDDRPNSVVHGGSLVFGDRSLTEIRHTVADALAGSVE